jgi:hypothetical protein
MRAVSARSYVRSIRLTEPGPLWSDARQGAGARMGRDAQGYPMHESDAGHTGTFRVSKEAGEAPALFDEVWGKGPGPREALCQRPHAASQRWPQRRRSRCLKPRPARKAHQGGLHNACSRLPKTRSFSTAGRCSSNGRLAAVKQQPGCAIRQPEGQQPGCAIRQPEGLDGQ